MSVLRIVLLFYATSSLALADDSDLCDAFSDKEVKAMCKAHLKDVPGCSPLDEPYETYCEAYAGGTSKCPSSLSDAQKPVCKGFALRLYSECNGSSDAAEKALCIAVTKPLKSSCSSGPYEGDWTGTVIGEVRFDAVEYACGGEVTVHIDDLNRVTGIVDCPITGNETQNCGFDLPEVGLVLDGPSVQHVVDCTGADWPGSVAIVTDTFVQGVVQGVAFVDSLGIEVEVDFTYSIFR